jgi:FMN phosphatase YigB (HAD superfamily)
VNIKIIILGLISLSFVFYRFCNYWILKQNLAPVHFNYDVNKNKKDFIILWDIHGVLFDKSIVHWIYLIITYEHLFEAFRNLNRESYSILFKYVFKKIGLCKEEVTNEELIQAAKKGNNFALINLIKLVACDYEQNKKVIDMIKILHHHGYRQQIASNIGESIFQNFYHMHQDIFKYFEKFFVIKMRENKSFVKKPELAYFSTYLDERKVNAHFILFIDDRIDNVIAAQKSGINAILFESAEQLEKEFFSLSLFPKE